MTAENNLGRAALEYAESGWPVIPLHSPTARGCSCGRAECESPGKHPRTARGCKDASRDPAMIREWWSRWPDANIGIVTGPDSGILVLDVDGNQGEESLIELARRGCRLPDTFTVRTGGGGRHIYFLWPEGVDVRNSQSRIAPGLDIRGQGGYVVAAPSLHASGERYEVNESAIPPAPCPEWLLSLTQWPQTAQARQGAPAAGAVAREPIGKGGRTKHLVSLAGAMHRRGMDPTAIEAALLVENTAKCSPPLPELKVRDIARNIPARYPNQTPEAKPLLKCDLVCLADVEARAVDWLWEPFIPLRMLSMISGDPGAGKSFVALSVAAELSRGFLRDGRIGGPADTLYLTVENPTAEVMRPRFDSLGGDPKRLHLLAGSLSLADVDALDAAITETRARLIVVDPIQSYLGADVDLHRSNETRPVMDGLARLAEKHDCAILLLRHLSKQSGGKAIHRGLGSIDLTGAVRSEMLAGSLPDDADTRAFVHIKSNAGDWGILSATRLAAAVSGGQARAASLQRTCWPRQRLPVMESSLRLPNGFWNNCNRDAGSKNRFRKWQRRRALAGPRSAARKLRFGSNRAKPECPAAGYGHWPKALTLPPKMLKEPMTFAELSTFDSDCGGLLQ